MKKLRSNKPENTEVIKKVKEKRKPRSTYNLTPEKIREHATDLLKAVKKPLKLKKEDIENMFDGETTSDLKRAVINVLIEVLNKEQRVEGPLITKFAEAFKYRHAYHAHAIYDKHNDRLQTNAGYRVMCEKLLEEMNKLV